MATATQAFQVMAKPAGALCNLDCRYCYYLDKRELSSGGAAGRMSEALLERYILQHIAASAAETTLFTWHGGEPTILGLDYFRRIVELQRRHQPPGRRIANCIQTNGTLLDEAWCRFLAEERFFVGLSLDGPGEFHDRYRRSKTDSPTHKQVQQAFRLLREHQVHCDVLCVVHDRNVRNPAAVYEFLRASGVEYVQFLPLVARHGSVAMGVESVAAETYGEFLIAVFTEWVRNDVGRIAVQNFDEALRPYLGLDPTLCVFKETCGDVVVVERNGDVYACDHFVDSAHRLGNIDERPLGELLASPELRQFGADKRDRLPRYCRECDALALCHGGCPKDRIITSPDGEPGLNYLCAGLRRFFAYSRPYLRDLAALVRLGERPARIMDLLRAEAGQLVQSAGRNQPCPCGSGRKFKKCCLPKPPARAAGSAVGTILSKDRRTAADGA